MSEKEVHNNDPANTDDEDESDDEDYVPSGKLLLSCVHQSSPYNVTDWSLFLCVHVLCF